MSLQRVEQELGGLAEVRPVRGGIAVELPADATLAPLVQRLVLAHEGPVAVAVGVGRDDGVDELLRTVDEVLMIDGGDPLLTELALAEVEGAGARVAVVDRPACGVAARLRGEQGQATPLVLGVILVAIAVAIGLGTVASAIGRGAEARGRADVAALAGARSLLDQQPALYDADPRRRISVVDYRARAITAVQRSARDNGVTLTAIKLLGAATQPTRVRLTALVPAGIPGGGDRHVTIEAEVDVSAAPLPAVPGVGEYPGPFAIRQGQRMRPDVALAFDRWDAAARAAGHPLIIVSAFRSNAEQAVLFKRHPDPKWVAPPGTSLHRLGTELDLGPASAYTWLGATAARFGFLRRYPWEAWHFGYIRDAGSASVGYVARSGSSSGSGERSASAVPGFVPERYASLIADAAQHWNVGAALLGAQLKVESGFDPNSRSDKGAIGIAQFMPGTAAMYGMSPADALDPTKAIPAQAHLMHDLLRKFGSVPLALAAYNAGDGAVSACGCVPAIPETQGYVQAILALLGGAGIASGGLEIRLVA